MFNYRHPGPRGVWRGSRNHTCCHRFRGIRWIRWIGRRIPKSLILLTGAALWSPRPSQNGPMGPRAHGPRAQGPGPMGPGPLGPGPMSHQLRFFHEMTRRRRSRNETTAKLLAFAFRVFLFLTIFKISGTWKSLATTPHH